MWWLRSRSQQQLSAPASQRERSPSVAQGSMSQGSATRVLGADITNRSPTPPPLSSSVLALKTERRSPAPSPLPLSFAAAEAPPANVRAPEPTSSLPELRRTDEEMRTLSAFDLPSVDAFMDAMKNADNAMDERQTTVMRRRRSRPQEVMVPPQVASPETLWRDSDNAPLWYESRAAAADAETSFIIDNAVSDAQPWKRARVQTPPHSLILSSPSSSCSRSRNETCVPATQLLPQSRESNGAIDKRTVSDAFFTPISTHLLLSSPLTSAEETMKRAVEGSARVENLEGKGPAHSADAFAESCGVDPSSRPLTVETPSQLLCKHSRLLSRELPSWQVMTAAVPADADGPTALLCTTPNGERRVRIVSAVDSTVVYSPSSLEDISPIFCLSDERSTLDAAACCPSRGTRTPAHLQNEETAQRNVDGKGCREDSVLCHRLFSQGDAENDGDEEERDEETAKSTLKSLITKQDAKATKVGGEKPVWSEGRGTALRLACDAFDELQNDLLQWQR